jgi:ribonuclease R
MPYSPTINYQQSTSFSFLPNLHNLIPIMFTSDCSHPNVAKQDQSASSNIKSNIRQSVHGITIDGPYSQDLDDAFWIEETTTGYKVQIHIADVAELVPTCSPADTRAIERTQTWYLSKHTRSMLPHPLENQLSLVEGDPKLTLTITVSLNCKGSITDTQISESCFTNLRRFSYPEADRTLNNPSRPFHPLLKTAQTLAQRLNKQRQNQGAIGGIAVPGGWIDEEGNLITGANYHSQFIIQELMILANRAIAEWLVARNLPALYRNHTARLIAPEAPELLPALLNLASFEAVHRQLQNWLNRAEYSPKLLGHFALNLPAYCHATSPIRRLADLVNHRVIKAHLQGQEQPYTRQQLQELSLHIAKVTLDNEESTKQFFKARAVEEYIVHLQSPHTLAKLTDDEFSSVLKYAISQGNLESLTDELTDRLNQGSLVALDLYHLLLVNKQPHWQQHVLQHLSHRIHDAPTIVAMACTKEPDWDSLSYYEPEDTPQFTCWAEVGIAKTVLTTPQSITRPRKQLARQAACLAWLAAYVEGELVTVEQRVLPTTTEVTADSVTAVVADVAETSTISQLLDLPSADSGQPFVAILNEFCQKHGWQSPEYFLQEGDGEFTCQCQLTALHKQIIGVGTASRKQTARHRSAWDVLNQLQNLGVSQD